MKMPQFNWRRLSPAVRAGVSRRGFLGGLLSTLLIGLGRGDGKAQGGWVSTKTEMNLGRFHVAGFRHHEGPRFISQIDVGREFQLIPEPQNVHDEFAVKVTAGGAHFGYIPRTENRTISRLLQQGIELKCRAVRVSPEREPWEVLEIEVTLPSNVVVRPTPEEVERTIE